jgi:glutaredoxin
MTARTTDDVSVSDFPDECPYCQADLTIDQRTDVETLHTARKAFTFEEHMVEEHPVIWWVAGKIAWVLEKLRR